MKIKLLDAHDRLEHFKSKTFNIGETCQQMIDSRPFGEHNFYIFAHTRTADDGVTKRLIWQPRLTKPKAQTNSILIKAYVGTDNIKVIWMIPAEEMWAQYEKGKLCESDIIANSIHAYKHDRNKLESKEEDDLTDYQIDCIYRSMAASINSAYISRRQQDF